MKRTLLYTKNRAALLLGMLPFVVSMVNAFVVPHRHALVTTSLLQMSNAPPQGEPDDPALQWQLFQKYHARGSWKGIWTTYDYIGDVMDETIASVTLDSDNNVVQQTHQMVVGAKRADCATCLDTFETQNIPVASYSPETLASKKVRLAANSMVIGPSLLRSGMMATELVLSHGDARVRVIFQHAPAWQRSVEPGSSPPDVLKVVRTMISRECLREAPPTAETEATDKPGDQGNPVFYRPIPPFDWHKIWGGTSWTWGPNTGNRGWSIDELEQGDDWHGSAPVELWNLRLPGGVFVQTPRIITSNQVGLCRLAWLPSDETLLRVEAGVSALQPMLLEDDSLVGFEPPSLTSLRCDVLTKLGDLEGEPKFIKDEKVEAVDPQEEGSTQTPKSPPQTSRSKKDSKESTSASTGKASVDDSDDDASSDLQAIRDALQL